MNPKFPFLRRVSGHPLVGICSRVIMFSVAIVQLFDFVFTSISIQDFLGTGKTFTWVPAEAQAHVYHNRSPSHTNVVDNAAHDHRAALTKWGYRILDQVASKPKGYLWASVGYFDSSVDPVMDLCTHFRGQYDSVLHKKSRFMSTTEELMLLRPMHVMTEDNHSLTTLGMMDDALDDGYVGTRRAVDIRMTARLDFTSMFLAEKKFNKANAESKWPGYYDVVRPIKAVRFYGKSFCDGCQPIMELGQMFCVLECRVAPGRNATVLNITVMSAHRRDHSKHRMGVAFPSTNSAFIETVIRVMILLYVAHVMLNVLTNVVKTNEERYYMYLKQGASTSTLRSSLVNRAGFGELFFPEQNASGTSSFSMSFIMYNSDWIVLGNFVVVILTFMTSMQLKHEVMWWAQYHETFRAVITRIGVNAKMMWLYLAVMKCTKLVVAKWGKVEWTRHMLFHSHLFVWFWLLYLIVLNAVGLDFLLEPLFKDQHNIKNNYILMNDISVEFQYGYYFIRLPYIAVHSIAVSWLALGLLIWGQCWIGTPSTSLMRQMASGHSMLVFDPEMVLAVPDDKDHIQGLVCSFMSISTLMNLKWFMKMHSFKFLYHDRQLGLFEHGEGTMTSKTNLSKLDISKLIPEDCCVMGGSDSSLHVMLLSTQQELECFGLYHEWLQNDRMIRIR